MKPEDYRRLRVQYHSDRITTFMTAARALKQYSIWDSFDGTTPPAVKALISALVREARTENSVACWFKAASEIDIENHMRYNYTGN